MTAPWEEYAAPAGPWEEYSNSAEAQPYTGTGIRQTAKRTALGTLKDTGVALAKGVVGAGEAAVGLADIVTPGNLGEGLRKHVGYDPAVAQQFLSSQYSQPQQEAIQRVEDAEGFTGTVKAALQNPSVIASTVGESLPSMIGGQFLARAGLRTLPRAAAALGTYAPVVAGALGEGAVTAGSMQENIRQQAGDTTLAQKGAALAAGAGTALLGAVGGRIAQKFGFIDPDTFLLSIGSKQTTPGVIKRIIGGGISESVFEEMPQSAQEQVWLNAATGKPLTEGLGESVALGGLAGAAMGAGFNVMQPRTQEKLDTVQQRTLSNLIKGAQVSVTGGTATIVEEGKPPVTMQVR
ncbi:MAG: hypothetical protein WC279_14730, partial [Sulfurimonas sp.]|uniref:hypothetical protein n=1 Tax=Sulfurimonas sp. TaxID=2022749 RepID=UPI00356AC892